MLAIGFVNLSWAPTNIAGVLDPPGSTPVVQQLTYDEWAALFYPTPLSLGTLPGDKVCQVADSPDLAYVGATFSGVITLEQWAATGFLAPTTCG